MKIRPAENQKKGGPREQREKVLGVIKEETIELVVLAVRKTSFFPLYNGSRKVAKNELVSSQPRASYAILFQKTKSDKTSQIFNQIVIKEFVVFVIWSEA